MGGLTTREGECGSVEDCFGGGGGGGEEDVGGCVAFGGGGGGGGRWCWAYVRRRNCGRGWGVGRRWRGRRGCRRRRWLKARIIADFFAIWSSIKRVCRWWYDARRV